MFRDLRDRGSEFRAVALKDLQSGVYGVLRGLFVLKTLGLGFLVVCFMFCLLFWLKLRVQDFPPEAGSTMRDGTSGHHQVKMARHARSDPRARLPSYSLVQ